MTWHRPGPGRPRRERTKKHRVEIYLYDGEDALLRETAAAENRTVSEYIRHVLLKAMKGRPDRLPTRPASWLEED